MRDAAERDMRRICYYYVMAGLGPAIHAFVSSSTARRGWRAPGLRRDMPRGVMQTGKRQPISQDPYASPLFITTVTLALPQPQAPSHAGHFGRHTRSAIAGSW